MLAGFDKVLEKCFNVLEFLHAKAATAFGAS